jgi:PAS domain S-box-containing protein
MPAEKQLKPKQQGVNANTRRVKSSCRSALAGMLALCLLWADNVLAVFTPPAELRVVTDDNYPPYLFRNSDGQLQGIVKEKWALWSKKTGIPARVEGMQWARAQESIRNDTADVIDVIVETEARKGLYEFSPAYATMEAAVFFHRTITGINDTVSMRGFTIGAKEGSACANWLADRGIETIRPYSDSEALIQAANIGEVRLFCMDLPPAQYFLLKHELGDEFRHSPPLYSTRLHWAVRKGRSELRDFIQSGFDRITPQELGDIDAHWLGYPLQFVINPRYWYYFGILAATIVAAAALLLLWNRTLRLQVAAKTADLTAALEALRRHADTVQDLYNNAPCGYHSVNLDGVYVQVNDTELRWLGYTRDEVIGKLRFTDLLTDEGRRQFHLNFQKFKELGTMSDLEYELRRKDGSTFFVLLSTTMIPDENGNFWMSRTTLYDITERKRAEAQIRLLNVELERRVAERTLQLEEANKEMESFSYSVSHDLRAPLRSISGFGALLLEDHAASLSPEGRDYLGRMVAAAHRMGELIDALLGLAGISRQQMSLAPVDLSQLAHAIAEDLQASAVERRVEFVIAEGVVVRGDPRLLRVVLENLLGNAWKYTAKQGQARIEFGVTEVDGSTAYFVRDNGVGFDMAYADKLFGAFQRLHSVKDFEGTGIGLMTVQRIVHRHWGRVWAEGGVGEGATFYFTLPQSQLAATSSDRYRPGYGT